MSYRQRWGLSADEVNLVRQRPGPLPVRVVAAPQNLVMDASRTVVVAVDLQNDFCHPDGWLGSIGVDVTPAVVAVSNTERLTLAARAAGIPVIWLNWGNRPDRLNLPPNVLHVYDADGSGGGIGDCAGASPAVLTADSWGAALVDDLTVTPDDIFVDKFRMSGFFDTPLDAILRQLGIDTILFAGVNADQCVMATLTDAACLGYDVVLVEGASGTTSPQFCYDATVYNVRQCFGFTATTEAVCSALADAAAAS